jgi:hypothetical protein
MLTGQLEPEVMLSDCWRQAHLMDTSLVSMLTRRLCTMLAGSSLPSGSVRV